MKEDKILKNNTEESNEMLLDWFWIWLFRYHKAIAGHQAIAWVKGNEKKCAKNGCRPGDLRVAVWAANSGAMPGRLPSHCRPFLPGGGSKAATYPVADSHQTRVNEGRKGEQGQVIQRINRDLK